MAQGLHLSQRLSQSLVLAPQLQQSLALLQAPTLELKALVEAELQQNPVLEEIDSSDSDMADRNADGDAPDAAADLAEPPAELNEDATPAGESNESADAPADDFQAEFEKLVQLDQDWRDNFSQANSPTRSTTEDEEKRQFMFDSLVAATSLAESLLEQVRDAKLSPADIPVAEIVIGNIDDYGYLKASVEEVARSRT